jgi:hypothetical protein
MNRSGANIMDTSRAAMSSALGSARSGRSGLVIDIDRETSRAVLFSQVEGATRFISSVSTPSTALPPIDDPSIGAKRAVRGLEDTTGLTLFGADGIEVPGVGEAGVDYFSVTGVPSTPLRVSLIAAGPTVLEDLLISAARRTLTDVDVVTQRVRTADGGFSGSMLESVVRDFRPDALVLVRGDAAESEWKAVVGTIGSLVTDEIVSIVIVVAGEQDQQQSAHALGDSADLRGIDPAEFAPVDIAAALEAELQLLYDRAANTAGLVPSSEPPTFVSRARAGELVARFVARRLEETVVSIDVSDGAIVHWASPTVSDVIVRLDVDIARNVRSVFDVDLGNVSQWLPMSISTEELSHWILNRALRPRSRADSPYDAIIERGILIALMKSIWHGSSTNPGGQINLLIAGRPFSLMESPGVAALTLLDIFEPDPINGIVEMVLDVDGLLFAAGAIGQSSPAIAADIVENDLLVRFATAVIAKGAGNEGEIVVRGQVRYEDGETTRFAVPSGSVHLVKMNPRRTATVTMDCEGDYSIGGHSRMPDLVVGGDGNVDAGDFGLIIDARGRPLPASGEATTRTARVASWLADLGFTL